MRIKGSKSIGSALFDSPLDFHRQVPLYALQFHPETILIKHR